VDLAAEVQVHGALGDVELRRFHQASSKKKGPRSSERGPWLVLFISARRRPPAKGEYEGDGKYDPRLHENRNANRGAHAPLVREQQKPPAFT
jgi:hypothetical protein